VRGNWSENFSQTQSFLGRTIDVVTRDAIRGYVEEFLRSHEPLFQQARA
jgi:aminoglycoside phosphotransferase family enzyme